MAASGFFHFTIPHFGYAPPRAFTANGKTIYSNPALIPDSATRAATFTFFNDGTPCPYHISIQGIDRNGRPLVIDTIFTR